MVLAGAGVIAIAVFMDGDSGSSTSGGPVGGGGSFSSSGKGANKPSSEEKGKGVVLPDSEQDVKSNIDETLAKPDNFLKLLKFKGMWANGFAFRLQICN